MASVEDVEHILTQILEAEKAKKHAGRSPGIVMLICIRLGLQTLCGCASVRFLTLQLESWILEEVNLLHVS